MPKKTSAKKRTTKRTGKRRVQRLVQDEIRKARDYFRALIDHSPVGMCMTTLGRDIVMVNEAVELLTGYGEEKLVGSSVTMFYPDSERLEDSDIDRLRAGDRIAREMEFTKKDGEIVPVIVTYGIVDGPDGIDEVIIESYNDQSVRKRLDRLKNEFVFVAAHELRNPVTAIRLLLDIVFDDKRLKIEPILRGYLQKMQEANERLIQLVDDLLEVSRSESGRLKIKVEKHDVIELTEAILEELRPAAVSKEVEFRYAPSASIPKVMADASKLKEIMANLVSNAIKYNITGGTVTVTHKRDGDLLRTEVSDSGIGITKEDLESLFQKFWRSEDVAVRAQSGTGLGLFIVKELVERMGGTVDVSSVHGKGSTFAFTLRIAK